jgi:HAD superfamily hydrolase (TIGR01459 family)
MVISIPPQTALATLTPLSAFAASYDGLLCDIWGVLHNVVAAFDAFCRYRAQGGIVILITNAPRSHHEIYPQLERFGVRFRALDAVVISGGVTSLLMRKNPDTPLFHFGSARDHSILNDLTNSNVWISDVKLCLLTGPLGEDIDTVDVYENLLTELWENQVEMIGANPDLIVRSGSRMVICTGSIAARYAQMGGAVINLGNQRPKYTTQR